MSRRLNLAPPLCFCLLDKSSYCSIYTVKTPELIPVKAGLAANMIDDINAAQDRIVMQTMSIDTGGLEPYEDALIRAHERGAQVLMLYDKYSYFDIWTKLDLKGVSELRQKVGELARHGITMQAVGLVKPNPFAGRHHIKSYVMDNVAYLGGGVNLTSDTARTEDFMLRYEDSRVASTAAYYLPEAAMQRFDGAEFTLDHQTLLMVDGGIPGSSPIYNRAVKMAQTATELMIASKMMPNGTLIESIAEGCDATFIYNQQKNVGRFNRLSLRLNALSGCCPPNTYKGQTQVHAKFCATVSSEGVATLTGSHNFNTLGIKFGTQEAAIYSVDPELHRAIEAYGESLIPKN